MLGKGKKSPKSKDAKSLKSGKVSVTIFWLLAVAISVSALFYNGYHQSAVLSDSISASHKRVAKSASQVVTPAIQSLVTYIHSSVTAAAESNLVKNVAKYNGASLVEVSGIFPEAARILVLPADFNAPALDQEPPISFAVVSQVEESRSAEGALPLEVHWIRDGAAYVETVAKIVEDDEISGFLLVSWPFEYFRSQLSQIAPKTGYVELTQMVPGGSRSTLFGAGDNKLKVQGNSVLGRLNGSYWLVNYYPALSQGDSNDGLLFPSLTLLISAATVALLLIILAIVTRELFKRDVEIFRSMISDASNQKLKQRYLTNLKQSQTFAELLRNHLREWVNTRSHAPQVKAVEKQPEESDQGEVVSLSEADEDLEALFNKASEADEEALATEAPPPPTVPSGPATVASSEDVFELDDDEPPTETKLTPSSTTDFPFQIIRAYDIRGHAADELTPAVATQIGKAFGSEALEKGAGNVVLGRDGRLSSQALRDALVEGILSSGCKVADVGLVPTPVLYFAAELSGADAAIMITGSHNPPQYNGMKLILDHNAIDGEQITSVMQRISSGQLRDGEGDLSEANVTDEYVRRIVEDVKLAGDIKVVIDGSNGAASVLVVNLFTQLGCEVVDLYCEIDGNFPNHLPDISDPENLSALAAMVRMQDANLGIAFDGDADRVAIVDSEGEVVAADRLLMLLAKDVLSRNPGSDVIFDIKCSQHVANVISENAGMPRMVRTGHTFMKRELKAANAILAGELSGHFILSDRWFNFDDGIYTAARIVELVSMDGRPSAEVFMNVPKPFATSEMRIPVGVDKAKEIVSAIESSSLADGATITSIDGVRIEYPQSWILARGSNTGPEICFRIEGDTEELLQETYDKLAAELKNIAPDISLPFLDI